MRNGYRLDLSGLGRLIDQLGQAEDHMKTATSAMLDAQVEDLDSKSLDHETKAFHDRWGFGIGKLATQVGVVNCLGSVAREDL